MSTSLQGVDSAAFADQAVYPYASLADKCNAYFSQWSTVQFWGRYFGPTDGSFSSMSAGSHLADVPNDLAAMRKYGQHWIPVLASPGPARISSNNASYGAMDAQAALNGLVNVINASQGHLSLGLSLSAGCKVYLDIEARTMQPYSHYWQGWYDDIFNYYYAGTFPFFPCAYVNPIIAGTPRMLALSYTRTPPASPTRFGSRSRTTHARVAARVA